MRLSERIENRRAPADPAPSGFALHLDDDFMRCARPRLRGRDGAHAGKSHERLPQPEADQATHVAKRIALVESEPHARIPRAVCKCKRRHIAHVHPVDRPRRPARETHHPVIGKRADSLPGACNASRKAARHTFARAGGIGAHLVARVVEDRHVDPGDAVEPLRETPRDDCRPACHPVRGKKHRRGGGEKGGRGEAPHLRFLPARDVHVGNAALRRLAEQVVVRFVDEAANRVNSVEPAHRLRPRHVHERRRRVPKRRGKRGRFLFSPPADQDLRLRVVLPQKCCDLRPHHAISACKQYALCHIRLLRPCFDLSDIGQSTNFVNDSMKE